MAFEWNIRVNYSEPSSSSSSSSSSAHQNDNNRSNTSSSSSSHLQNSRPTSNPDHKNTTTKKQNNSSNASDVRTDAAVKWEIRIPSPQGDILSSRGTVRAVPLYVRQGAELDGAGWVRCRGVVSSEDIPIKGRIEVWVVCGDMGVRAVEANHFDASNVSTSLTGTKNKEQNKHSKGKADHGKGGYEGKQRDNEDENAGSAGSAGVGSGSGGGGGDVLQIGGDYPDWSYRLNQVSSLRYQTSDSNSGKIVLPKGFTASRRLLYSPSGESGSGDLRCSLTFQAKLRTHGKGGADGGRGMDSGDGSGDRRGGGGGGGGGGGVGQSEAAGWGYEWCVVVVRSSWGGGRSEIISEGDCRHVPFASGDTDGGHTSDGHTDGGHTSDGHTGDGHTDKRRSDR